MKRKQNNKQLIQFVKSAIEHNKRIEEYLETILNELGNNNPQSFDVDISDVRELDSMKMIEEILKHPEASRQTLRFVKGIKDFKNETNFLSESQRFHLETTYHNLFGD